MAGCRDGARRAGCERIQRAIDEERGIVYTSLPHGVLLERITLVVFLATGLIAELVVHLGAAQAPYVLRRRLEHVPTGSESSPPGLKVAREIAS